MDNLKYALALMILQYFWESVGYLYSENTAAGEAALDALGIEDGIDEAKLSEAIDKYEKTGVWSF